MDGKLDQKENGLDVRIFKERFWPSVITCNQGSTGRPLAVLDIWRTGSPPLKSSQTSFFHLRYKAGVSGRKQGIWKSRTAGTSTSCRGLLAISSFVVLVGCSVDEHVQNHNSSTNRSLLRIDSIFLWKFRLRNSEIDSRRNQSGEKDGHKNTTGILRFSEPDTGVTFFSNRLKIVL